MQKKEYKKLEEEQTTNKICESAVGALAYEGVEQEENWEDKIPIVGHSTLNELLADIEQSEQEFKEGKGVSWDTVKGMIENRIRSYAR